ncbi:MAG: hypothetical protein ABR988_10020 [Terriglobales bacterium]|jgi:hypothetical protein
MAGEVHDGDDGIALQMVIHECNQVAFGWVSDPSRMTMTNTQVLNNLATQTTLPQNPTWKDLRLRRGLLIATWRASLDYSLGSMAAARFRLSTKGESKLQQRQFCAVWG